MHLVCLGQDFSARIHMGFKQFFASVLVASFIIAHYYRIHEKVALSNGVLRDRTRSAPRLPAGTARPRRATCAARGCGRAAAVRKAAHFGLMELQWGHIVFTTKFFRIVTSKRLIVLLGMCVFAHCVRNAVLVNSRARYFVLFRPAPTRTSRAPPRTWWRRRA